MKTSDIPNRPVLELLWAHRPRWCFWGEYGAPSVTSAMPKGTHRKLQLSKMRALIRRGLVDGCPCGCRGDFRLTPKGIAYLGMYPDGTPLP